MRYLAFSEFSPNSFPRKSACIIIALALFVSALATGFAGAFQADLRFELPANGNLRVENLRGAVIVQVWQTNYVSVAAIGDNGETSTTPPVVDRGDGLLSIRVARAPKGAPRINLQLRVPQQAHLAIQTADGPIEVENLPAALLAQSFSGEITVNVQSDASASVVADSKTGTVSSTIASLPASRGASPQLQGRLGSGGRSVKLYSQAGNISLGNAAVSSARTETSSPTRTLPLEPAETPTPKQRPELAGPKPSTASAGTPAKPDNGPEEISEGDVIRVDTELVGLNVSVIDRGTNRGVNDLTKEDFRLYEDNTQQQIAHFETASA